MNKNTIWVTLLSSVIILNSCTKQNDPAASGTGSITRTVDRVINPIPPYWVGVTNLPNGTAKAFGFSIGNKGYIGGGFGGPGYNDSKAFFQYDPSTGVWSQLADVGGLSREDAAAFVIGGNGYVTTGYHFHTGPPDPNQDSRELSDTWEYIPGTNTWVQRADFPGGARDGAVGMAINNLGYAGTGTVQNSIFGPIDMADWWQFDPVANTWTQKNNFPGGGRRLAAASSTGLFGYMGTGHNKPILSSGETFYNDWYLYDPSSDSWFQRASLPGSARMEASCFSGNGYVFLGTGTLSSYYPTNDFWKYNPSTNSWTQQPNCPASMNQTASFVVNGVGYLGSGTTLTQGPATVGFWGLVF